MRPLRGENALGLALLFISAAALGHSLRGDPTPPGRVTPASASGGASSPAPSSRPPFLPAPMASLSFDGGEAAYFPAGGANAQPLTVFLHGMCATGRLECPVFSAASRDHWLLCPDGAVGCQGGGWMWASTEKATETRLLASMAALREREGARVSNAPMTIIGYSLGAPGALLQALREPGRYDRLMIVNASVEPAASMLKKARIRRVAFVSGERDATASKLRTAARRLEHAGVDAKFFALEATGHYFDGQSASRMAEPLAWLQAPFSEP